MNYWVLPPRSTPPMQVPLAQISELLTRLGQSHRHAVAEDLLRLVGGFVALAQCTVFSYNGQGRPRIVGVGDRARTAALSRISQDYIGRFYRLDGSVAVMQAEQVAASRAPASAPHILLHRQRGEDVAHGEYRAVCYELPQVAERLAILALYESEHWLSVNFYRGIEHGHFEDTDLAVMEAFAPLVVQAVRLHYTHRAVTQNLPEMLLARIARREPSLTRRDLDVVQGLLTGRDTAQLASDLGLTLASARTYIKRVYRKLGVAGQRELLGLLMESELPR
ncbi:MAG: helix-turn-helix transcriptional regulator [Pigmentiphaga sp.]